MYTFLDYRKFIGAYFAYKRSARTTFSYRLFAKLAGFKSPNYIKLLIEGERNLKPESAYKLAAACQLDQEGVRYFETLVSFNQASSAKVKEAHYRKLQSFRAYREAHPMELAHAQYYANWYIPVVFELAARKDFQPDAVWVAGKVLPRITKKQAREALETLLELGVLEEGSDGKLRQAHQVLSTGPELHSMHIAAYHRAMMARACEAIDVIPSDERDISSLTLCVGPEEYQAIKQRIQRFRRELIEIAEGAQTRNRVLQANIQLFPMSQLDQPSRGTRR